jgi:hypothetical protein
LYERLKILGLLRLDGSDDNVFTSLLAAPGFIKHAIGLACTGYVTKKNLKRRTPTLVLFRLRFWTRSRGVQRRASCKSSSDSVNLKERSRNALETGREGRVDGNSRGIPLDELH